MIPGLDPVQTDYAVDDLGSVVALMRDDVNGPPFFMAGHRAEIADRLRELSKYATTKDKKYPLIALRMDIPEDGHSIVYQESLNVGIFTITLETYNAEERREKIIKPILYPLYWKFLRCIKNSGLFMWPGGQKYPPHQKVERPYWGTGNTGGGTTEPGTVKKLFDDPVDCIEIVGLKINSIYKPC